MQSLFYNRSTHCQLWNIEDALVVSDCAHYHSYQVGSLGILHQANHSCKRYRWTINLGHKQPLQDDLVEL